MNYDNSRKFNSFKNFQVISELKEMRSAARWFQTSQLSASNDLLKWAVRGENRAIQETAAQLVELNMIWTEVQKGFCGEFLTKQAPALPLYKTSFCFCRSAERPSAAV